MKDPTLHESTCGCRQLESGVVRKCWRHLLADAEAAKALEANPPRSDGYAT